MKIEKLDLLNKKHNEIFYEFYKNNENSYKEDTLKSIDFINQIERSLNIATAFIYFFNDEPCIIFYACPDIRKNYTLTVFSSKKINFYLIVKCLKSFLKYLFSDKEANKIKVYVNLRETKTEFLYRYTGFVKEGMLRAEKFLNKRPIHLINLALTKRDFEFISNKFANIEGFYHKDLHKQERNKLKDFIKKIKR
ncbi:MAG: hypothetical protein U9P90_02310 [Patescibacteria group bacterium]|nr:hypothetical protein [Patescibacteria group bacterium]